MTRAAAFARVVAAGRAVLPVASGPGDPGVMTGRVLTLAEQLEHAGHLELQKNLG